MATTLVLNSSGWTLTSFYGGEQAGRSYLFDIPDVGSKVFTDVEFLAFFESLPASE